MTIENVEFSGDEAQAAFGNTVNGDLVQQQIRIVRGRPQMVMTEDRIVERVTGYVTAHNHDEIVEALRRFRGVAVTGPRGAGTATTAIAALRQLQPSMPIRYFSTDSDDMEEIQVAGAQGYLVRAHDESKTRLWACLDRVREVGGYLLVVGRPEECQDFAEFLATIEVKPPPTDAVYRRRLSCRGLGGTGWPGWPRAAELLERALPGDGRRLADLVLDVTAAGGDEQQVERAYQGWADELRHWFARHDLREQTLMVAAATITPADETSVYDAALWLARQLEMSVAGGGLAWCPTTGLAALLEAERDGSKIVFRRQSYRESVLRYVWNEYPLTRMDLLTWLSKLAIDAVGLETALRNRLAEVFAELAAGHGEAAFIADTARRWTGKDQLGANLAYIALANTCLDPLVGGRVRRRLYEWSTERRAPQTLKLTVARVCQVLGEAHVSIALTRLKHLTTYGDEQVQAEVHDVALKLAVQNRATVIVTAMRWCEPNPNLSKQDRARRTRAGLRLLCAFLDGQGPADPHHLRRVLRVLGDLAERGGPEIRPIVLDTARELAARYRADVLDAALTWAGVGSGGGLYGDEAQQARIGTELFLDLAAERDHEGLATALTGPAAVDPYACTPAWAVALGAEPPPEPVAGARAASPARRRDTGYGGFEEVARLWLDTAARRADLRPGIVAAFCRAAGHEPARAQVMVDLVRRWAGSGGGGRRTVKDDVLVRLLQPEWRRILLAVRVRLFGRWG
ncbi:hypothetical protein [Actinomadura rugatobispora]|uniref:ATP-binding protein n=1 Tax=Actinomadura rugatobispora TaxID=1994 RepID=A0ABW0ZS52_9ACTN|nr:hypothetical protein GCM10010200_058340 [Actinomadura rugatobispora]